MKKILSVLLSSVMLMSVVAGIDFSAYAGSFDTMATAKQYTIGTTVNGYFSSNDTKDFIKFTLNESGIVNLVCSGSNSYHFSLYEKNGNYFQYEQVNYNYNLGMAYAELAERLVAGTYYLEVVGNYINENYSINTSFMSANESFFESQDLDNDVIGRANPISLDMGYTGQVGPNDKDDFYSFTVADGVYNIYVKADAYIKYAVYTTKGEYICGYSTTVNSATGYAEDTKSISLSAGTYCIKISPYYNYGANYSFAVLAPHQHYFNYYTTVASTYTTQGYDIYSCSCGESYCTNYRAVKKLGAVTIGKVSAQKKRKIKVSWKKKNGASGYQIYWSRYKNFKKIAAKTTVKGGKTTSYTGKNFTKGKKYYVKVRAYKTVNGKKVYGKWSKVKSVTCK